MAKKLQLVPTAIEPSPTPPRGLGEAGLALWRAINAEYQLTDAGGVAMLAEACVMLDRAEELRVHIEADGAIVHTNKAGPRDHPGLKHELAARSFVVRTLQRLGLDVEATKPIGRPPAA